MKKPIAFCIGIISAVSLITAVPAYAEEYAAPTFYFGVDSAQNVSVNGDTVTISRDALSGSDFTLNVNVYVDDPDLKSWYVSPKWKCASEYIKLSNLFIPNVESPDFAYGIVENNRLKYSVTGGNDENYNTMYFTCQTNNLSDRGSLLPLGATSDEYALTSFDAVISSDIPDGVYEIYFLTESEDYTNQQTSDGAFRMDDDSSKSYDDELIIRNLTVIIGSEPVITPMMGDVDYNGLVDPVDATLVLRQYSIASMNGDNLLTEEQISIGNVDENDVLDVVDATNILRYYSYFSMDNSFTWDDLFSM